MKRPRAIERYAASIKAGDKIRVRHGDCRVSLVKVDGPTTMIQYKDAAGKLWEFHRKSINPVRLVLDP